MDDQDGRFTITNYFNGVNTDFTVELVLLLMLVYYYYYYYHYFKPILVTAGVVALRFRIPWEPWMSLCWKCCVLSDRSFCDGPITCPESYRLWCVCV